MKINKILSELNLEVIIKGDLDREVSGVYIGDLLSNVMARAKSDNIWITIQSHQNVVAVAFLLGIPAVLVVEGFEVKDDALSKAREKNITILRTSQSAYETAINLYKLGID